MASTKRKKGAGSRPRVSTKASTRKGGAKTSNLRVNPLLRAEVEAFASMHQVTPREREVLLWMAAGRGSAEELAEILGRSINTIQNHIKGLLRGVGTNSKSAALALFIDYLITARSKSASRSAKKKR